MCVGALGQHNHSFHNLACFPVAKKYSTQDVWSIICRFGLPQHIWNQIGSFVQLHLLKDRKTVGILKIVEPFVKKYFWDIDKRILVFAFPRRSADHVVMRSLNQYVFDTDEEEEEEDNDNDDAMNGNFKEKKLLKYLADTDERFSECRNGYVALHNLVLASYYIHNNVQVGSRDCVGLYAVQNGKRG